MVVVCGGDTSRKITLSRAPDHLTAMGMSPALPESNVNGLRKLAFFPSIFTILNVWQPFYCVYKLWKFWAANYENIEKSYRTNSWSRLRQRTDCKVLEKWAASSLFLPVNFGILAYYYANLKPKRKKSIKIHEKSRRRGRSSILSSWMRADWLLRSIHVSSKGSEAKESRGKYEKQVLWHKWEVIF